jgi:pimeloyl-ACP methyl ester carboxylesterase
LCRWKNGRHCIKAGQQAVARSAKIEAVAQLSSRWEAKNLSRTMAEVMRFAASNVEEGVIPESGHWIMEENPKAAVALVRAFVDKHQ